MSCVALSQAESQVAFLALPRLWGWSLLWVTPRGLLELPQIPFQVLRQGAQPWCVISGIMEGRLPAWCLWDAETRSVKPV